MAHGKNAEKSRNSITHKSPLGVKVNGEDAGKSSKKRLHKKERQVPFEIEVLLETSKMFTKPVQAVHCTTHGVWITNQ